MTPFPTNLNQYLTVGAQPVVNGAEHAIASYEGAIFTHINDERLSGTSKGNDNYQLAYDALGRCVKRTLNGVSAFYVYDGEKPIVEYNATGGIVALNVYGKAIDEILVRTDNGIGQTYYYQQDHEGSVTHLTDSIGQVVEKYRYDAFGKPTILNALNTQLSTSAYNNRFLFTGREYAAKFGIYEYRARAYHPGLGRFMSEDPIGFAAGDYNLFRYCGNDPLDRVDPSGLVDANTMSTFLRADWIANSAGISNADMALLGLHISRSGDMSFENDSSKSISPGVEGAKQAGRFSIPGRVGIKPSTKSDANPTDYGHNKEYRMQVLTPSGEPLTVPGMKVRETLTTRYQESNIRMKFADVKVNPANSKGIFTDSIGLQHAPPKGLDLHTIRDQNYHVYFPRDGQWHPTTTVLRQEVKFQNSVPQIINLSVIHE